jgi:hypothetical protein
MFLKGVKMITRRKNLMTAGLAIAAVLVSLPSALAAVTSRGTAAVWPVVFSDHSGTTTARATAVQAVREALQKGGFTLIAQTVASGSWKHLNLREPTTDRASALADIEKFGRAIHARYIVQPMFRFHTRSIWVDVGPRTISTAYVTVRITDTTTGKVVYHKVNVQGRSDAKTSILKYAGAVLITPLVTVVSGGPKTPEEQRAVQVAVAYAMHDWVAQHK